MCRSWNWSDCGRDCGGSRYRALYENPSHVKTRCSQIVAEMLATRAAHSSGKWDLYRVDSLRTENKAGRLVCDG